MDEQQSKGTETYAEAAARLLRVLEQRANKASGGLKRPEQIQTGSCPRAGESDGGQFMEVANCNHRPHPALGGQAVDRSDGQVSIVTARHGESGSNRGNASANCPSSPDDSASGDRAKVTLRADLK